jgi:hypothetical protein
LDTLREREVATDRVADTSGIESAADTGIDGETVSAGGAAGVEGAGGMGGALSAILTSGERALVVVAYRGS